MAPAPQRPGSWRKVKRSRETCPGGRVSRGGAPGVHSRRVFTARGDIPEVVFTRPLWIGQRQSGKPDGMHQQRVAGKEVERKDDRFEEG